jgi:hypothetical protein
MRTMTIVTILLFAFFTCAAPELSESGKRDMADKVINELKRIAYEAEFTRFVNDLRVSESPDWTKVNKIGCMGWFQFAPATLTYLGYGDITPAKFSKDPDIFPQELQLKLVAVLIKCNEIK